MSANVSWRPVDTGKKDVHTSTPAELREVLCLITESDRSPFRLSQEDRTSLLVAAKAGHKDLGARELADALNDHDEIEVYFDY